MKINYQTVLDRELDGIRASGRIPKLLLHSCCGPCSSYVLEYLSSYFDITVYYYNPNIEPESEYAHRLSEQQRLISSVPYPRPVGVVAADYDNDVFREAVSGLEDEPEGGARCERCFRLRLGRTAMYAREHGFDYFTTTLSVSPHKNAQVINACGREISEEYGVPFLFADFKKRDGYKRSIELSGIYGLYRQDYCGCSFSVRDKNAE